MGITHAPPADLTAAHAHTKSFAAQLEYEVPRTPQIVSQGPTAAEDGAEAEEGADIAEVTVVAPAIKLLLVVFIAKVNLRLET